jgi:hypothetical protein
LNDGVWLCLNFECLGLCLDNFLDYHIGDLRHLRLDFWRFRLILNGLCDFRGFGLILS